jgi:chromosome segregation ATPase
MKRKCESLESDIKICRSKIPDIKELFKQAEELAQRAEAARLQANAAQTTLEAAEEETKKLTAAEEELQDTQRNFTNVRRQLQMPHLFLSLICCEHGCNVRNRLEFRIT